MSDNAWNALYLATAITMVILWFATTEVRSYLRRRDLRVQLRLLDHLQALSCQHQHTKQGKAQ
ncbi:hypothetical protein [Asaia bogorensis]|uniref:Uncharacterized protein n=1 Tax=Asaia bogorensis NBRC 16594 TaxID=1231624 RepID=A0AAN4R3T1_9PROT|nr:hypothetical protein [Asaia bogorensis]BAT19662.1 hypothetical protein Asbog_01389 [Asaia bogorensis NBRC 16594]GBQ78129.1 hypothetical protein AA0311_1663 [Asaia bogorensis NBRC 16594]GEL53840.1 hypothetical protein ABO01nite_18470 [Asaia bogorensis NBRC 16594]